VEHCGCRAAAAAAGVLAPERAEPGDGQVRQVTSI
jgi:hypothetical protein